MKMITRTIKTAGAYCTMCMKGEAKCHSADTIMEGFKIDRTIEDIQELAMDEMDEREQVI